jgi:hypothetical protein
MSFLSDDKYDLNLTNIILDNGLTLHTPRVSLKIAHIQAFIDKEKC